MILKINKHTPRLWQKQGYHFSFDIRSVRRCCYFRDTVIQDTRPYAVVTKHKKTHSVVQEFQIRWFLSLFLIQLCVYPASCCADKRSPICGGINSPVTLGVLCKVLNCLWWVKYLHFTMVFHFTISNQRKAGRLLCHFVKAFVSACERFVWLWDGRLPF